MSERYVQTATSPRSSTGPGGRKLSVRQRRKQKMSKGVANSISHELDGVKLRQMVTTKLSDVPVRKDMLSPKGDVRWHFTRELINLLGFDPGEGLPGRSKYDPKLLVQKVIAYDGESVFNVEGDRMRRAFSLVHANYSRHLREYLEPLDLVETPKFIKTAKAAGYPYKQGVKKGEVIDDALENAFELINCRGKVHPCTAFFRTQGRKKISDDPKVRLIWGYPLDMLLLEAQFAVPLLQYIQTDVSSVAMGERKLQLATRLNHYSEYTCIFNGDWKGFDSSVPTQIISLAFKLLESLFGMHEDQDPPKWVYTTAHNWELVKRYFCTCGIIMPDATLVKRRRKGIPSGSFFTSIVGSICNELIITYLFLGQEGLKWEALYLGDDTISGLNKRVNIDKMVADAESCFGMRLVCDKLNYGKEIQFLGHYWEDARPKRPISETFQRLAYPERWNTNVQCFDLIASLYGDNCLLWDAFPDRLKIRMHSWWGIDHAQFLAWERVVEDSAVSRADKLTL